LANLNVLSRLAKSPAREESLGDIRDSGIDSEEEHLRKHVLKQFAESILEK